MDKTIRPIIRKFVETISGKFGNFIVKIILFGSVAKEINQPDSDCDILIVMREKKKEIVDAIYDIVVDFSLKYRVEISLKIYTEERYNFGISLPTPFMKEIMKTGIELWIQRQ